MHRPRPAFARNPPRLTGRAPRDKVKVSKFVRGGAVYVGKEREVSFAGAEL